MLFPQALRLLRISMEEEGALDVGCIPTLRLYVFKPEKKKGSTLSRRKTGSVILSSSISAASESSGKTADIDKISERSKTDILTYFQIAQLRSRKRKTEERGARDAKTRKVVTLREERATSLLLCLHPPRLLLLLPLLPLARRSLLQFPRRNLTVAAATAAASPPSCLLRRLPSPLLALLLLLPVPPASRISSVRSRTRDNPFVLIAAAPSPLPERAPQAELAQHPTLLLQLLTENTLPDLALSPWDPLWDSP